MLKLRFRVHAQLPVLVPRWLGFLFGSPSLIVDNRQLLPVRWNRDCEVALDVHDRPTHLQLSLFYNDPNFFAELPSTIVVVTDSDCFEVKAKAQWMPFAPVRPLQVSACSED